MKLAETADNIPGLEWLSEADVDALAVEDAHGFVEYNEGEPKEAVSRRLYMLMSNQQAMDTLLSEWRRWQRNPTNRAQAGFGPLRQLFIHLLEVRRWSAADRIAETGVERYWRERLVYAREPIPFEVELWFREDATKRAQAAHYVEHLIRGAEGRRLQETCIEGIRYHAILAECPPAAISRLLEAIHTSGYTDLLRCQEVMFFRPIGQSLLSVAPELGQRDKAKATEQPMPEGQPIVALLDGMPMQNHECLRGRLQIDDPDDFESAYQAQERKHGTAMASLIVHGDRSAEGPPLTRPVYVRPVMKPQRGAAPGQSWEAFPEGELFVDLFHRAVQRIVTEVPSVRIVNVSLGDVWRPFIRELSPLARLLDWLSWQHGLLFLVSAGNYAGDIELELPRDEYEQLGDDDHAVVAALRAMRKSRVHRRLLSPAEAVNAVTVGAAHVDASGPVNMAGGRVDLLRNRRLPSPIGTLTGGLHRSVKPEILLPGGRLLYTMLYDRKTATFRRSLTPRRPPGQKCAGPGENPGDTDRYVYTSGSSNAAAMATRLAAQLYDRLLEMRAQQGGEQLTDKVMPVLVKALLVHGASWGSTSLLDQVISKGHWSQERLEKAQLLGFGFVDHERVLASSPHRVVMLSGDQIALDQGHEYTIPLPVSLGGRQTKRRVIVTLAWLTPIYPRHRKYRRARLYVNVDASQPGFAGSTRKEVDDKLTSRGTVEHMVLEEERRVVLADDDVLRVRVSCREEAGPCEQSIPYGLAVTIETAEAAGITIYDEIRRRIRPHIPVRVRGL